MASPHSPRQNHLLAALPEADYTRLLPSEIHANAAGMGGKTTPSRAVVQAAGESYRLEAGLLKTEFNRYGPTMHLLLRYTQGLITQMTQTAVCNRHHYQGAGSRKSRSARMRVLCGGEERIRSSAAVWSPIRATID